MANVETLDNTVRGKGGHGPAPHITIDPIVRNREVNLGDPTPGPQDRGDLLTHPG